ncbi:hypothetical protein AAE478_007511 [Parahypoxylon ruwenzoriense]
MGDLEAFRRFPCGATFNGNLTAPHQQFWIPYSWCNDRCPGWGVTRVDNVGEWLKPMISFIIPSLAFCLNIPRRRRLRLPSRILSSRSFNLTNFLVFALKVPLASFVVTLDIVIWTCTVFSLAGPMIISGIREALLDARLLTFLDGRVEENSFTIQERVHTLLVILIGNLDINAWPSSRILVEDLPNDSLRMRFGSAGRRIFSTPNTPSLLQNSTIAPNRAHDSGTTIASSSSTTISESIHQTYTPEQLSKVASAKSKLRAMLDSQVSFGSSVGAPILFYVASFIWSVLTAHQLAYGMFWTTIPHIALVSCLLLAGNNTNIWQAAASESITLSKKTSATDTQTFRVPNPVSYLNRTRAGFRELPHSEHPQKSQYAKPCTPRIFDRIFVSAFQESEFRPAWMWNRGSNKAIWISRLAEEYPYLQSLRKEVLEAPFKKDLLFSGILGFTLYFMPVFFGSLVSYNTPQTGFGCRTVIMLSYAASQLWLQMLWLLRWYTVGCHNRGNGKKGFWSTIAESTYANYLWLALSIFGAFLGALSSIGGTILLLMNVLTNCFCATQAKYWSDRWTNPNALIFVDDATSEQIYYAQKWWFPAGVVAVVFMVVVAYIGWWYQRSLRQRFHNLVTKIDYVNELNLLEGERHYTNIMGA